MTSPPPYEVVVVGGGPAGLTAALYTTRLGHRTALVNREGGRYTTVRHVHNLVGISEETSGADVTRLGIDQLLEYGADYYEDAVETIERNGDVDGDPSGTDQQEPGFEIHTTGATLPADRVVLATGFSDEPPRVPGLRRFTGTGLYYCLHCDAYTLGGESVFVLGHDDHAAHVAMVLLNVTGDVDLLLNGAEPAWSDAVRRQVEAHPVEVVEGKVDHAFAAAAGARESETHVPRPERQTDDDEPRLGGLEFADGTVREYAGGFAVYGRRYHTDLAADLGCDLTDDGAVAVDDRQETSVRGVYAAGDLTHGQNQTPVALGDGARAGIAVHKDLRPFPVPADSLDEMPDAPTAPADLLARMALVRDADVHAGMTPDDGG